MLRLAPPALPALLGPSAGGGSSSAAADGAGFSRGPEESELKIASSTTDSGKTWFSCPTWPHATEQGSSMVVINHAVTIVRKHSDLVCRFFSKKDAEEEDTEEDVVDDPTAADDE